MRRIFFLALLLPLAQLAFAQTLQDGISALENENLAAARKIFNTLSANPKEAGAAYYYLGESYNAEEKADSAKIAYSKGIAADPKSGFSLVSSGRLLQDAGNAVEALKVFEKATKAAKKDASLPYLVGMAYTNSKNKNLDQAINFLSKSTDMNRKSAKYFTALGDAFMAKGDGGKAANNYQFAINSEPNSPYGYVKLADTYIKGRAYKVAIENLEKAISLAPKYAPAYKSLIDAYYYAGQYSKMTPLLKQYTELAGDDLEARARYIRYLYGIAKNYDAAIEEGNRFLAIKPDAASVQRVVAYSYVDKEKWQEGYDGMKKFFAVVGTGKVLNEDYEYLAKAAEKSGKMAEATENYKKLIALDPTKVTYLDNIAKALYTDKKYAEAIVAYEEKIKATKPAQSDYYYIGLSNEYLKDYAKAEAAYGKMLEINPSYAIGHYLRAEVNSKLDPEGKMGIAKPHYQKFIELGEADRAKNSKYLIRSYSKLGEYAYKANDLVNAKAAFSKVLEMDPTNATAIQVMQAGN